MRQARGFNLLNVLFVPVAIIVALIVILGLTVQDNSTGTVTSTTEDMLEIVAVVGALTVLIGIFNLFWVHLERAASGKRGWIYSIITLLSATGVVAVRIMDENEVWTGELKGEAVLPSVYQGVQVSIESALAGIIVFFLVYAAFRLMEKRPSWSSLIFILSLLLILIGGVPLKDTEVFKDIRDWLWNVPVLAGSRGLLIGIGLGSLIVGIRVLLGLDQAYREQ